MAVDVHRTHISDEEWMERALALAESSVGLASPNPAVGCVLVRDEAVVGEGFHAYDEIDHAEIVALKQAGEQARGATAYVTLEPCSHHGRTGPCADALIAAGVQRVVAAVQDPNPAVSGQGFKHLQAAGISITLGICETKAKHLNEAFARFIRSKRPFVTLKAGLTLDGRVGPPPAAHHPSGSVHWITSDVSRAAVQQMRHAADAVLTGIGTVMSDDPLMTDRSGRARRRPLLRVVLDSALRLRPDSQLVRTANNDVLVFCTRLIGDRVRSLEALGVRVERLTPDPETGRLPLAVVLERLAALDITHVMLEAGASLNATALAAGIVDKLFL
ncbi:MAG TPA: bifunctional diaminohydroxyphosphoribosylaminopyrimidine deaminase/5-amino-6-(5-phosphoribosylamino)uracil reductase RibD, partial [Acidobacteriaceae bacterium]|nr:bifunctional diaminohydroxyphosphoribosylaminopyrimidine deaminase/5-amino-6-(5-phosphoribosylamino)uracil reductase RibD [Acidobacteriaceae bacterium]